MLFAFKCYLLVSRITSDQQYLFIRIFGVPTFVALNGFTTITMYGMNSCNQKQSHQCTWRGPEVMSRCMNESSFRMNSFDQMTQHFLGKSQEIEGNSWLETPKERWCREMSEAAQIQMKKFPRDLIVNIHIVDWKK